MSNAVGRKLLRARPRPKGGAGFQVDALEGRVLLSAVAGAASAIASPATAVGAVHTLTLVSHPDGDSNPYGFARVGNQTFFASGTQLWKTDGTTAGTVMVAGGLNAIRQITAVGNTAYFVAAASGQPNVIWRSDGTAAGTAPIDNMPVYPDGNQSNNLTSVDGTRMVFTSGDSELYSTDGTAGGTFLLDGAVRASSLTHSGNLAYYGAGKSGGYPKLYRTDGTVAGTYPLFEASNAGAPTRLTDVDGTLYFSGTVYGRTDIYKTNGTVAGTVCLTAAEPTSVSTFDIVGFNGGIAYLLSAPTEIDLWLSNGTPGAETMVGPVGGNVLELTVVNGKIFFFSRPFGGQVPNFDVWISDGTVGGTHSVATLPELSNGLPGQFVDLNGIAGFTTIQNGYDALWRSDGTGPGTYMLISQGIGVKSPAVTNGNTFMGAYAPDTGWEPYISDGTYAGTRLLKNINTSTATAVYSSFASNFTTFNNVAYFTATTGTSGADPMSLWRSDGTDAGTAWVSSAPTGLFNLHAGAGALLFLAPHGPNEALWSYAGGALTAMLADVGAATQTFAVSRMYEVNGITYLLVNRTALWRTDGTPEGTRLVHTFPAAYRAFEATALNGHLIFGMIRDNVGTDNYELWQSDGSDAGTSSFASFVQATNGEPLGLMTAGNAGYFRAGDADGVHLYRTDGTAAGTYPISDLQPRWMTASNGKLYFYGRYPATLRLGLFVSDGTAAGTTRLLLLPSGTQSYDTGRITDFAGQAWFTVSTQNNANTLWRTDGTLAGTVSVTSGIPATPGVVVMNPILSFAQGSGIGYVNGVSEAMTLAAGSPGIPAVGINGHGFFGHFTAETNIWAVDTPPAPPTLNVQSSGGTAPVLTWGAQAATAAATDAQPAVTQPPVTGYVVDRKAGLAGTWGAIATLPATQTTYTDTGATPGVWYYYRVEALNASGASPSAPVGSGSAQIAASVFADANVNGIADVGEGFAAGVRLYLDLDGDGAPGPTEPTTLTDAAGGYRFDHLPAGNYVVRVAPADGFALSAPVGYGGPINLPDGGTAAGPGFGQVAVSSVVMDDAYVAKLQAHIGGPGTFATGDLNGDGAVDATDLLVAQENAGHPIGELVNGGPGVQTFTLSLDADGASVDWTTGAAAGGRVAISDPNGITINGNGGNDTIVLNYANGSPLPNFIHLNGSFTISGLPTGNALAQTAIDIGRSTVYVTYAPGATPAVPLQRAVNLGYHAGGWNGLPVGVNGAITSTAARVNALHNTGVALVDNADGTGINPVANTILLKYAVIGDTDLDGTVGLSDYTAVVRNFATGNRWDQGVVTYGGTVNLNDYTAVVRNFGQTAPAVAGASATASVTGSNTATETNVVGTSSTTDVHDKPDRQRSHRRAARRR